MNRKICIHCHFYQPPRENPWLEDVEMQDSAFPFHDWNERITDECYRRNGVSRILDANNKTSDIFNNYAKISFNFGPTLLIWMEKHKPEVYQRILDADKASIDQFGGHGSAIAQAYNHMIMPLCNTRDKQTQVVWGIEDFRRRFNRQPEGMWLPETAVDIPSLEALARNGIRFTILAPYQAAAIRRIGAEQWHKINGHELDTRKAYLCKLPSGAQIVLFFYNNSVAQRVAYGNLISNGDVLANEMLDHFDSNPSRPQLSHIATDGETYGHHYRHGDMALAYCLHSIETKQKADLTVYGQFLEECPPEDEVQIHENTSWSCSHGVERWKSNCGCSTDPALNGKQEWRGPLRNALDWLRDQLAPIYEQGAAKLMSDPWGMRDRYIRVILDRSSDRVEDFLSECMGKTPSDEQIVTMLRLFEIQRNAMLMYTSCGWFFNDISGLETTQILRYAARAMQLASDLTKIDFEPEFENRLLQAPSSYRGVANGKEVYQKMVKPSRIDIHGVAAHTAISALFDDYIEEKVVYCFKAYTREYQQLEMGTQKLAIGRTAIYSNILHAQNEMDHIVLYFGSHNLTCGVANRMPDERFYQARDQIVGAFKNDDTAEVIRLMNLFFGENTYSLWHLFRDALHQILYKLLQTTWDEINALFRHIYEQNYTVMKLMRNMQMVLPKPLAVPAEFVLSQNVMNTLFAEPLDIRRLEAVAREIAELSLQIDEPEARLRCSRRLDQLMQRLRSDPLNLELLNTASRAIKIVVAIMPHVGLEEVQNLFFIVKQQAYEQMSERAQAGDQQAIEWESTFHTLANYLNIAVPQLQVQK
ncbi:MAG: DUF3536 domain-containing protein [Planctomycetaceae bacterium]|nr:DUF3536 domain-containing protein [Planctomycetaceae bacterium]